MPVVTRFKNSVYQLNWEPAQAHGSQITLYRLEGLVVDDSRKQDDGSSENWNLYYNGTDCYWIIPGDVDQKYQFRVQAKNAYGFGAWSRSSVIVDLTESAGGMATQQLPLMLGLIAIVITVMLVCFCYFFCRKYICCDALLIGFNFNKMTFFKLNLLIKDNLCSITFM